MLTSVFSTGLMFINDSFDWHLRFILKSGLDTDLGFFSRFMHIYRDKDIFKLKVFSILNVCLTTKLCFLYILQLLSLMCVWL